MGRKRKGILCLGLLVWALYASFQAETARGRLDGAGELLWLRNEEGIRAGDARKIQGELQEDGAAAEFVLWREQENTLLRNPQTGLSSQAEALYLCGSSRLLYPGEAVLDGEDQKGCLLGRKAAYELFGSGQAQGLTLYLGQTAYEVRGVLAEDSRRVVVRAGAGEVLDQITARIPQGQTRQGAEQTLSAGYGIYGTPLEFDLLCLLAGAGTAMLWVCLGIGAFLILKGYENRVGIRQRWKRRLLAGSLIGLWVFFAVRQVSVPVEYLPTKWSDFDFFANLWQEKGEALFYLFSAEKQGPQAGWSMLFLKTLFFQAAGGLGWLALGALSAGRGTRHSGKNVL